MKKQLDPTTVLTAMGENRRRLEDLWGGEFLSLVTLIAWSTRRHEDVLAEIAESIDAACNVPTLIIFTERDDDHRQWSLGYKVVKLAMKMEAPFHVLFSGGNYYSGEMEEYGELPAPVMKSLFLRNIPSELVGLVDRRCTVEQISLHSGYQGRMIGGIIRASKFYRVVPIVTTGHIVRFMLTFHYDLVEKGGSDEVQLFGLGVGEWGRVLRRGLTHAEEAFGPILELNDPRLISKNKVVGGEYERRLFHEVYKDLNKWCGCTLPSEMCRRLGLEQVRL